jgi:hypothetical protein
MIFEAYVPQGMPVARSVYGYAARRGSGDPAVEQRYHIRAVFNRQRPPRAKVDLYVDEDQCSAVPQLLCHLRHSYPHECGSGAGRNTQGRRCTATLSLVSRWNRDSAGLMSTG